MATYNFSLVNRYFLLIIHHFLVVSCCFYHVTRYFLLVFNVGVDDYQLYYVHSSCQKVLFPIPRNECILELALCSHTLEALVLYISINNI